jgi:hypothetical protein
VAAREWRIRRRERKNVYFLVALRGASGEGNGDGSAVLHCFGCDWKDGGDEINLVSKGQYTISWIHGRERVSSLCSMSLLKMS